MSTAHISNFPSINALGMGHLAQGVAASWHKLLGMVRLVVERRPEVVQAKMTPFQEAESLRGLADEVLAQDPCFAQDLYAQADRLERAALA